MMGILLICISKMATPGRLQFSYDLYLCCMSFEAVLGNKEFEMTLTGSKAFNFWGDMVYQYYGVRNSQKYLVVIWTT